MSAQLKRILSLIFVFLFVFALAACRNETDGVTQREDGKFVDKEGNVLSDNQITLDFLAQFNHGKDFDALKKASDREDIIRQYLVYHLPASSERDKLITHFMDLEVTDRNIIEGLKEFQSVSASFVSEASTVFSLADFCVKAFDEGPNGDWGEFGKFMKKIDQTKIAGTVLSIAEAGIIISELNHTDISDKDQYCDTLIDALQFITDYVPVLDGYFSAALDVVDEGIDLVLNTSRTYTKFEESSKHKEDMEFFGIVLDKDTNKQRVFEFILKGEQWWNNNAGQCPTIADLFAHQEMFADLSEPGVTYLREYIIYRIGFEMEHPEYMGTTEDAAPIVKACAHVYEATSVTEPTCAEEGYTTYTCSRCGDSYNEKTADKLPHTFEDTVVAPTLYEKGYTLHTCSECGFQLTDSPVSCLTLPDLSQGNEWYGFGDLIYTHARRLDLTISEMDDSHISGTLVASRLYETKHESTFEGTGTVYDDYIEYQITFATPATLTTFTTYEYHTDILRYDLVTGCFIFADHYDAELQPMPTGTPPTLAQNATWSGYGEDPNYNYNGDDHLYTLEVYQMNELEISGYFTLSYNGTVDHEAEFVGKGYRNGDTICYEVKISEPFAIKIIYSYAYVDAFDLEYDCETGIFKLDSTYHNVELEQR